MKKQGLIIGTMILAGLAVAGQRTYEAIKSKTAAKQEAIDIPVEVVEEEPRK